MKTYFRMLAGALVFVALGVGPAIADDQCRSKKHSGYEQGKMLKYADQNEDGKITEDEFISHAKERFKKMDRNGDGSLDEGDRGMHHSFDSMDKDADGQISREEFDEAHTGAPWGRMGSKK